PSPYRAHLFRQVRLRHATTCRGRTSRYSLVHARGTRRARVGRTRRHTVLRRGSAEGAGDLQMIIPCIDLQYGKLVQLIQGQKKALEGAPPLEMLERFKGFPVIQVIDLDAAMGKGLNLDIVRDLASRARTRVGGGVRTAARARELVDAGAERVILGTA